jgi:hypothetical protein
MQKDERDALEVLKFELNFIDKGGYGPSTREPWRPQFVFEDSPTCMNYDCKENPGPCSDCILMRWVPPESREEKVPCRHIPLGPSGETLDTLYRWGDQREIEEAVASWLRGTIEKLERERESTRPNATGSSCQGGDPTKGTPLYEKFHPKCANPACPIAFHWLGGGKFFRFRPDEENQGPKNSTTGAPAIAIGKTQQARVLHHGVRHFWLCERCSHVFTLEYSEENGVVLKLRCAELPLMEARGSRPQRSCD